MKITVTAEHITRGVQRNAKCCPVALAVREHFGRGASVLVRHGSMSLGETEYWLPTEARLFIEAFDCGEPVAPFSFALDRCP